LSFTFSFLVQTVWADAGAGRHDAEILERALAPFEELVALLILLILALDVLRERLCRTEEIDHDRVVDHQVDRHQRVDLFRITAEQLHAVAHGGQIDHGGNAGEILHQHARRAEADLGLLRALVLQPGHEGFNVLLGDRAIVLMAQQVLQQHFHGKRQLRDAGKAILLG
jgi:hypothetical protein